MDEAQTGNTRESRRIVVYACALCDGHFYAGLDGTAASRLCTCDRFDGEPHPPGWYAWYRRDAPTAEALAWWDETFGPRARVWLCPSCGALLAAANRAGA